MNTGNLDLFKSKRKEWLSFFSNNDPNSIWTQIVRMTWKAAVFRVINEARRMAPLTRHGGVALNGMIHHFINECFFDSQMAAIRRLNDRYSLSGKRGTFSLWGLLGDMENVFYLFTRESIFGAEDLTYDYSKIESARQDYIATEIRAGSKGFFIPHESDFEIPMNRHKTIDFLSGVKPGNRRPSDTIQKIVFARLKEKLGSACDRVNKRVDKFVAHAATSESRSEIPTDALNITLDCVWKAHREICGIANFISVYILGHGLNFWLPTPNFAHMDVPMINKENLTKLEAVWNEFDKEIMTWSNGAQMDLYIKEISGGAPG